MASVGSLAHTQWLPLPGLIFFHAFVRNFKVDQSSQKSFFFVMFIEKCHTRSKTKHLAKTLSHICRYERCRRQAYYCLSHLRVFQLALPPSFLFCQM